MFPGCCVVRPRGQPRAPRSPPNSPTACHVRAPGEKKKTVAVRHGQNGLHSAGGQATWLSRRGPGLLSAGQTDRGGGPIGPDGGQLGFMPQGVDQAVPLWRSLTKPFHHRGGHRRSTDHRTVAQGGHVQPGSLQVWPKQRAHTVGTDAGPTFGRSSA